MLSVFCYITLTLLNLLINKFTTCFSGEEVSKTPVLLKTAIQLRKKMAYMILRILQALDVKTNTLLQRNFTINKGTKQ